MKKQVVFIYDPRSNKLIRVADVKSLSTEAFFKFEEEAKKNLNLLLDEEDQEKRNNELRFQEIIQDLSKQIDDLRSILKHLLGYEELEEEAMKTILYGKEEKVDDEN